MGKRGPKRTCDCGDLVGCRTCRRREQVRQSYHRRRGKQVMPLAPLPKGPRPPALLIPNDDRIVAYLAGLMDGEGCITRTNGRPVVQIGMTDEGVILWLHETLGGNLQVDPRKPPRKQLFRWRVLAQLDVLRFLWAVYPYMRVRREAAEEAILEIWGKGLEVEETLEAAGVAPYLRMDELLALERA